MEQTWGDRQQPRLAEHFEPILVPLALLFFLWDDVRILLIAQSIALALGALPVYWIARQQFSIVNGLQSAGETSNTTSIAPSLISSGRSVISNRQSPIPNWSALAFTAAYLLFPHLQAANIADFHADPFVVTPLLFAFWYATQRRWRWMWFWAGLAMATKETLPTLTAMLGLYLIFDFYRTKITNKSFSRLQPSHLPISQSPTTHGLALFTVSTLWFLIATFLIVAPLARHYFGTDGPIYLAQRYGGEGDFSQLWQEPARWRYLIGLLAAVGLLPLLAPEMLILGLPVLLANFFSRFPGQYSGEQHYSAPLVAAFVVAAIYGARRLIDRVPPHEINGQSLKIATLIGAALWLLVWSVSYHALHGWTPLSVRMEHYAMTPAAERLPGLIAQIPAEVPVSASAGVHPHVAHRRVAYVFPAIENAEYFLIDLTDIPGVHPNDARAKILELLQDEWELLAAADGLILARRSPQAVAGPELNLPEPLFDFVRTTQTPTYPVSLIFGDDQLRLLGYDLHDDPDDGISVRFYWQAVRPLPADLRLWPLLYDDTGQLLMDPTQVPMIATVWYPPARWQANEVIITETLPQLLPDTFHLGIAVGPEKGFADPSHRYPIQQMQSTQALSSPLQRVSDETPQLQPGRWAQLATFRRQGPFLEQLPPTLSLQALTPMNIQLGPNIYLTGFWLDTQPVTPGERMPLLLRWMADAHLNSDFTVFVHLLAPDGTLVAQSDAYPTWLTPVPTSQWSPNQVLLDRHTLALPKDLPAGLYTLQLGLYYAPTMEHLIATDGKSAIPLSQLRIE